MKSFFHRKRALYRLVPALGLLLALGFGSSGTLDARGGQQWFSAWGSSQQSLSPATQTVTDGTVRMIARTTIKGNFVRVRLENVFGLDSLVIGDAFVGLRDVGAALVPGSNRQLTFGGLPGVTIPAGGGATSDPVGLKVEAQQDLAVSLYIPGASVQISRHNAAFTTSYLTVPMAGDHAADEAGTAFPNTTTQMYWLAAVDVFAPSVTGAIVCLGDSITDGTRSTVDGHDRWEDVLARRLPEVPANQSKSVVNEGIAGNRINPPGGAGPAARLRLDRDVLSRAGVTHVIFFEGTNDIAGGATANDVIAGSQDIIDRVHAAGLKIFGVTMIPRHNAAWTPTMTGYRHVVNDWIRNTANFDAVIDFDAVVRDPSNPDLINPLLDSGDHIHPNPTGYAAMGNSVNLGIFENIAEWAPAKK